MTFIEIVEFVGNVIDGTGVAAMVIGAGVAGFIALRNLHRGKRADTYKQFRQQLGRSILLGLELLVAADIIRTVAVTPTLTSVAVLAAIVVIRTFLSFPWNWRYPVGGLGKKKIQRRLRPDDWVTLGTLYSTTRFRRE